MPQTTAMTSSATPSTVAVAGTARLRPRRLSSRRRAATATATAKTAAAKATNGSTRPLP